MNLQTTRYNELDAQYRRYIFTIALNLTHHMSDAEDVTQNTLLKIWRALPTTHFEEGKEKHWIAVVARHAAIDFSQAQRIREASSLDMLDEEPEALEGHEPEARAITREAIGESLDSLCAMQREALVLKVHGGYTYREIADVLGITFDEARGRIERARRHIRRVSA